MKKVLIAAGCVVFSVMSSSKTMAADLKFDQLFSFGDSLSDTGNLFTLSTTFPGGPFPVTTVAGSTQPAYSPGRFSNGDIWVDYFSKQIGQQTPTPFASLNPTTIPAGGVNFAFGGAQTGKENSPPNFPKEFKIPGVLGQVGLFQQNSPNLPVSSNAIYSFWGGSNDYFAGNTNVNEIVGNLTTSISSLAQGGAKNFLVFNLADLGETPLAKREGLTKGLNFLTQQHNELLASALNSLRDKNPELNIYSVDVNTLFRTARNNPSQFKFDNVTGTCVTGNFAGVTSICNDPNSFLFFDDVHPSSRAHELIANAALAAVKGGNKSIPEPSMGLGVLTLASLGAFRVLKRKSKKLVKNRA
jgi:phospholipase/lecithinase/hemolysin